MSLQLLPMVMISANMCFSADRFHVCRVKHRYMKTEQVHFMFKVSNRKMLAAVLKLKF